MPDLALDICPSDSLPGQRVFFQGCPARCSRAPFLINSNSHASFRVDVVAVIDASRRRSHVSRVPEFLERCRFVIGVTPRPWLDLRYRVKCRCVWV